MSQTFTNDNIYLNGGTLLGAEGTKLLGACLFEDSSHNKKLYILNDNNGLSGFNFTNHTLYGPQESGSGTWLQYDTNKITSIDCVPVSFNESCLIVACNTGKIASFDGTNWKYPDSSGSGTGPYDSGSATGNSKITKMASKGNVLVLGTEDGRISSYKIGVGWSNYNAETGFCSNGDMFGRRPISLIQSNYLGPVDLFYFSESSGRFMVYDLSSSSWSDLNLVDFQLGITKGDNEITDLVCLCNCFFFSEENGYVAKYNFYTKTSSVLEEEIVGNEEITVSHFFDNGSIVFGSSTGKLSSFDGSDWKLYDGSGSGSFLYDSGSVVNNKKLVSVISLSSQVFLFTENKIISTGNFSDSLWYKFNGTTSNLSGTLSPRNIPLNMLALFDDSPPEPWGLFPFGDVFPIGSSGFSTENSFSDTHEHEYVTCTSSTSTNNQADNAIWYHSVMNPHTHTLNHSHEETSHVPLNNSFRAACVVNSNIIPTSARILYSGSTIPTGWSRATYTNGNYLKFSDSGTGAIGGSATHEHVHPSSSSTAGGDSQAQLHTSSYPYHCVRRSHSHTVANHQQNNEPSYIILDLIKPNSEESTLPSGTVAFFLGSTIPAGWSLYSQASERLIKLGNSNIGTTGGTPYHSHYQSVTSSIYNGDALKRGAGGYSMTYVNHSHTFTHTHNAVTNNSMPLCRSLLIAIKD